MTQANIHMILFNLYVIVSGTCLPTLRVPRLQLRLAPLMVPQLALAPLTAWLNKLLKIGKKVERSLTKINSQFLLKTPICKSFLFLTKYSPLTAGPTDGPPETCCTSVKLESTGAVAAASPGAIGSYRKVGEDETGRAVYKKDELYLHYVNDVAHRFEAWVFSGASDDLMGDIVNEDNNDCADATGANWEVLQVMY